jgi:hypothetical protein
MEKVRQIAELARNSNEAIHIMYRVEGERDLKACAAMVRGMQNAFSSLRAKARRKSIQMAGESFHLRDPNVRGPYDNIACVKTVLPHGAGFKLSFMPGYLYALDLEIVNDAGEPIEREDPATARFSALFIKVLTLAERAKKNKETWYWPLNPEETAFIRAHDQQWFEDNILHEYLPWMQEDKPSHYGSRETQFGHVEDLAEMDDELEFDNPNELEEN